MRPGLTDMERAELAVRVMEPLWPKWVQHHFRVSASTVTNWRKGRIPPDKLSDVLEELKGRMGQEEAPPPEWAEGLVTRSDLAELEARLLQRFEDFDSVVMRRLASQLERLLPTPDEDPVPRMTDDG